MVRLYYMHIWLVESSMVTVLHKANFSLLQRNTFYLTIMVVVKTLVVLGVVTVVVFF